MSIFIDFIANGFGYDNVLKKHKYSFGERYCIELGEKPENGSNTNMYRCMFTNDFRKGYDLGDSNFISVRTNPKGATLLKFQKKNYDKNIILYNLMQEKDFYKYHSKESKFYEVLRFGTFVGAETETQKPIRYREYILKIKGDEIFNFLEDEKGELKIEIDDESYLYFYNAYSYNQDDQNHDDNIGKEFYKYVKVVIDNKEIEIDEDFQKEFNLNYQNNDNEMDNE